MVNTYEKMDTLLQALFEYKLKEKDPDAVFAEKENLWETVKNFLIDCYDAESLIAWLSDNDLNPVNNITLAEFGNRADYEEEEWEYEVENCLLVIDDDNIIIEW